MTEAAFLAPRRRATVYEAYEAPFPVPRSDAEAMRCRESVYRADLVNQQVLVRDPAHIELLYGQGYFGKGILSRARPDYSLSDRWQEFEGRQIPVISKARYEQLLSWRRDYLLSKGMDEEAVNQILVRLSEPIEPAAESEEAGLPQTEDSSQKKRKRSSSTDEQRRKYCPYQDRPHTDPAPRTGSSPVDDSSPMADSSPVADSVLDSAPWTDSAPEYVLVEGDSDEEVCPIEGGSGGSEVNQGGVRRLPFSTTEVLQLTLEEAFFLVYALGCLSVHHNQKPLSISELWGRFRGVQPGFESSYAAYHYYRSRAWVPKPGAKYGAHFMLYRKGPPFYHASYSVVVEQVRSSGASLRPFTWRSLAALSRITANVSKELMMCYIIYPADLSEAELTSPLSLHRLTVQEVVIKRWISSRERAELDDI
ncbi:tRNA-splicing endonuclease subunit Sen2 [Gadus macrocephalus]|uniref:tRNA-splicing endonuclease subunit Sen2 n=1 Tax=Gadus macrocephalus TaxID=80720 RepID=UPI0028CBAA0D|nr:tRNA-splicing endonuclease subunit Sen2 [Gadus macrocephalus]